MLSWPSRSTPVPMQAPVCRRERWYQGRDMRVRNCVQSTDQTPSWNDDRGLGDRPGRAMYLTNLQPDEAGACWYGLRFWIDDGTQRVSRHWLVLSVATLFLAYGTRVEDASELGIAPGRLRTPPLRRGPLSTPRRTVSVLRLGIAWLSAHAQR